MIRLLFLDLAPVALAQVALILITITLPNLGSAPKAETNYDLVLRALFYLCATYKLYSSRDYSKQRLLKAIERNDYLTVKTLLDWGVDVNFKGMELFAIEIVRRLARISTRTTVQLPLIVAAEQIQERYQIIKLLLDRGAEVNYPGNYSPLWFSCKHGHKDTIELLLKNGADVNHSADSITPLMIASAEGHDEALVVILEHVMEEYRM